MGSDGARDQAMDAAIGDLAFLMSDAKRGAFDPGCLDRAAGLRAWISATPGLESVDLDLEDPWVFGWVLRAVDAHAAQNPVARTSIGRGSNYTTTQAVRAIGWLIRIDDQRGSGSGLEKRRADAEVDADVEIAARQLASDRWQKSHHLGDAYLQYLRQILDDPHSRAVVLGRVRAETRQGQPQVESPSRTRRRTVVVPAVFVGVVAAIILAIVFWSTDGASDAPESAVAAERTTYDNKDPRGIDSTDSKCADPPPSESIDGNQPSVTGPGGSVVGQIQLRASSACPHVVWARVLWNGQESGLYTIPAGWTLHTIVRRPDTGTTAETTDAATGGEIPYGLSKMLTTVGGHCVLAEAYFTRGSERTSPAQTACVVVGPHA